MPPLLPAAPRCSQQLPAADFYADRRAADGLRSACKPCVREQSREYHADHTRDHRLRCRRWYRANIDYARAKARENHYRKDKT